MDAHEIEQTQEDAEGQEARRAAAHGAAKSRTDWLTAQRDERMSGLRLWWGCRSLRSCTRLFETPWTTAHHAPLSMGFPRQDTKEWVVLSLQGMVSRDEPVLPLWLRIFH